MKAVLITAAAIIVNATPISAGGMGDMKGFPPKRGSDYDHFIWGAASAASFLVCDFTQKGYNIPRQDTKDALEAISKDPDIRKEDRSAIFNAIKDNKSLIECHQILDELGI